MKRRLVERTDVIEYWTVDPDVETVRIYRRHGESFERPTELAAERGEVLCTPLLPGFELPLARLFRYNG